MYCSSNRYARGVTLMELMVTLVILSILAAAALPYAELTARRGKELELRRTLREVRTAIDRFHTDWVDKTISRMSDAASEDGYPKTLEILIDGAEATHAKGGKIKYLRRVPPDPFGDRSRPIREQWVLRGYRDDADTRMWNGNDVYDIRSASTRKALDGTRYRDW